MLDSLFSPKPVQGFRFIVKVIDVSIASGGKAGAMAGKLTKQTAALAVEPGFQEVSGLSVNIETESIKEGGTNYSYKVPKSVQYEDLVLKRGIVSGLSDLVVWCEETMAENGFKVSPRLVILMLLNASNIPVAVWKFENAYPIAYSVAGFNAESNELAIETIKLTYTRFEKVESLVTGAANMAIGAARAVGASISADVPNITNNT